MGRKKGPEKPKKTTEEIYRICSEAGRGYWTEERLAEMRALKEASLAEKRQKEEPKKVGRPKKVDTSSIEVLLQNESLVALAQGYVDNPDWDVEDMTENCRKVYDYLKSKEE